MLAAATLPAAMARMAVAGPVTQSPPAKTPVHVGDLPLAGPRECAALDGHARLLKALDLDALADGDDDDIRRDALSASPCRAGTAVPADLADDLRLDPQRAATAVLVGLDAHGRVQRQQLRALGQRALDSPPAARSCPRCGGGRRT